jgi:hypothetical protein
VGIVQARCLRIEARDSTSSFSGETRSSPRLSEAVLVTNDDGLVGKYRAARRRRMEDACYPGLIHLRSNKEEVQKQLLDHILKKFIWNEVIVQDCLITAFHDQKKVVRAKHESLCHHEGYERRHIRRS